MNKKNGPIEFSLNIKKKKYLKNKVYVEKCIMSNNLKQKIRNIKKFFYAKIYV